MQRTTLAVLVVSVAALVAAGGVTAADDGAVQDDTVAVELYVTTPDGDAIGGADATVEWDGGSVETTTRSNGRVFEDVPAGADLTIDLEHDDYVKNVPQEVEDVEADQVVQMRMYPPATLAVSVNDSGGADVEGATVRLRKDGQSAVADRGSTDENGAFSSEAVEEGTYEVLVRKPGYYDVEDDVELVDETHHDVTVERGRVTIDLETRDPTPEGSGGVDASVAFERDDRHVKTVSTSADDATAVTLDVNTRYDLEATSEDYQTTQDVLRTGEEDEEYVLNMTRSPLLTVHAENQQIVVGENLRVEVRDEYERPVEGAAVFVDGEERAETGEDGVARVQIQTRGDVQVHAEADGLESDPITVEGVGGDDEEDEDDGAPGFGPVAALTGVLVAAAILAWDR